MSGPSLVMPGGRFARRINSNEATRDSLDFGPTVVVPPKHLMAPSSASEVATAMAKARHEIDSVTTPGTPPTPVESHVTDKYAFAFDIDGVLIRGGKPLPEAIQAMKLLNGENEYGIKV
jgi:hypothetical protein